MPPEQNTWYDDKIRRMQSTPPKWVKSKHKHMFISKLHVPFWYKVAHAQNVHEGLWISYYNGLFKVSFNSDPNEFESLYFCRYYVCLSHIELNEHYFASQGLLKKMEITTTFYTRRRAVMVASLWLAYQCILILNKKSYQ